MKPTHSEVMVSVTERVWSVYKYADVCPHCHDLSPLLDPFSSESSSSGRWTKTCNYSFPPSCTAKVDLHLDSFLTSTSPPGQKNNLILGPPPQRSLISILTYESEAQRDHGYGKEETPVPVRSILNVESQAPGQS